MGGSWLGAIKDVLQIREERRKPKGRRGGISLDLGRAGEWERVELLCGELHQFGSYIHAPHWRQQISKKVIGQEPSDLTYITFAVSIHISYKPVLQAPQFRSG